METATINKQNKDRLFKFIFGSETRKQYTLDLYNAVNGTAYSNPEELTLTTIEDVIYMGMKNDVSFLICDDMNLYEHQSSYNPNMPLRGLLYFGKQYDKYLVSTGQRARVYGSTLVKIPTPKFIVFYNGDKRIDTRTELKLSDAFISDNGGDIEVKCTMININADSGDPLLYKCEALQGYAEFNAFVKKFKGEGFGLNTSVNMAVDECIKRNILKDIFEIHKSEVIEVCIEEYNEKEVMEVHYNEGREEGREEERTQNILAAIREGLSKETVMRIFKLTAEKYAEYMTML